MEERKENAYPELEYFFCHIEGVGFRTLKKLIDRVPNWEKAYELPQKQLEELLGSKMVVNMDPKLLAKQILDDMRESRKKLGWDK